MAKPFVDFLKQNYPYKLVGVEIGVFRGENAELILQSVDIEKLYLIDPYQAYTGYNPAQLGIGTKLFAIDEHFEFARNKLAKYGDKVQFIRKKSGNAYTEIPNNLGFVYIDGNHKWEYVWDDLCHYYPKLKRGGLLAGDNLEMTDVAYSVVKFCHENKLKLQGEGYQAAYEWWAVK